MWVWVRRTLVAYVVWFTILENAKGILTEKENQEYFVTLIL